MALATMKPGSQMIWAVVKQGDNLGLDALDTRSCAQDGRSLRGAAVPPAEGGSRYRYATLHRVAPLWAGSWR
jgi:hypothetical protein